MSEDKLDKIIRSKIRKKLSSGSSKRKVTEREVRKRIRKEILDVLSEMSSSDEKGRIDEAAMGMVDIPAVGNGVHGGASNRKDSFNYNPDAVSDMAKRDAAQMKKQKKQRNKRRFSSDAEDLKSNGQDPNKALEADNEAKIGREVVTFVNEENQKSVATWIEDGQFVCEIISDSGKHTTELSEEKTKKIVEHILEESSIQSL